LTTASTKTSADCISLNAADAVLAHPSQATCPHYDKTKGQGEYGIHSGKAQENWPEMANFLAGCCHITTQKSPLKTYS
jgi:uncharacterized cupin superfamily protein